MRTSSLQLQPGIGRYSGQDQILKTPHMYVNLILSFWPTWASQGWYPQQCPGHNTLNYFHPTISRDPHILWGLMHCGKPLPGQPKRHQNGARHKGIWKRRPFKFPPLSLLQLGGFNCISVVSLSHLPALLGHHLVLYLEQSLSDATHLIEILQGLPGRW